MASKKEILIDLMKKSRDNKWSDEKIELELLKANEVVRKTGINDFKKDLIKIFEK